MATLREFQQLRKELAESKQDEETDLQAKIASLSTVQMGDLLHLKEHWTQEAKSHRALDHETIARRKEAELWLRAIAFVLRNPAGHSTTASKVGALPSSNNTGELFKTFSLEYLAYVKNNFAAKTHENAERVMKFFVEQFGHKDLGAFTLEDLEQYKAQRLQSGVSNTTINIDIRTIKAAFGVARDWKRIAENPFGGAKQLRIDQRPKRILTAAEFEKILASIKEDWLHDIIAFNILTGLRLGEIMNLKWTDYDVPKSEITIQSSTSYRVKGGKMRVIPLGRDALAILHGRRKSSSWIFVGANGKKYTDDYVSKKFKQYVRDANLPEEIHYHRLRDTYLTWLAEANVPVHIIKALAGHSSVCVTEGYLSPSSESMRSGAAKIQLPSAKEDEKEEKKGRKGKLDSKGPNS